MANGIDADGRQYVEVTLSFQGEAFDLRFTLIAGRTTEGGSITCHVDFRRQSDSSSGRYENVSLSPRSGPETHQDCIDRNLTPILATQPIPSPVFP